MFNLGHVALLMLLLLIGWWLLRNLGLRDQAMRLVRNHCQRSDVQLLDDSIALTGMRIAIDAADPAWFVAMHSSSPSQVSIATMAI